MLYHFHDFELDDRLYQLRRSGKPVSLEPKVFDVLAYLLHNRDRIISKDELLEKLWPGQVVSETALTRCIVAARKAVSDDGTKQEVIETQHGRGYRFVAAVNERVVERKLAAILHADVKGYSRLMGEDEVSTLRILTAYREVTDSLIKQYRGRIVDTAGDSILAEFASAVDAVQCAMDIQQALRTRNADLPSERRMEFRIGINVGDIIVEGLQIYGDGVNIAARVESLGEAGGICVSGTVYDQIKSKLALQYESLGEQPVKNIAEPVRVYRVVMEEAENQKAEGSASQKAKVKEQKSKIGNRDGSTSRSWPVVTLAGALLIAATIGTVWYFSRLPLSPQSSALVTGEAKPPSLSLPDKPSIVVLPFVNMSEDPEQDYFSDGLTEDLITDLSKLSGLFVIARNSAFTYKGKATKVQDISREMGVRYVLEGSVRKADGQVRISTQLIDATTGYHLWSERYDRPFTDIFALQEEIRRKIVMHLALKLTDEDQARVEHEYTSNPEAYDSLLRGWEYFNHQTKEANTQARQMFEKAIELDPAYAVAYVGLSWTYWLEWTFLWSPVPQTLEQAFALMQKARALDDSLAQAHLLLGRLYLWKKQHEQAIAEAERAVALAPNFAEGYAELGFILNWAGRPEEAIGLVEKAQRLDPRNPTFYYPLTLGQSYRLTGRYEEAIAAYKRTLHLNPNLPGPHAFLAVIYNELGQEEEARAEVAEALRISPNLSLENFRQRIPFEDPAEAERVLAALRKAGLK